MAASGRVVVFGSLNVDSTSYVEAFPAPGETVLSHGFQVALGGKGSNQAVAAHVAGAPVEFVARIGDDATGDFAIATLGRFGLPTAAIERVTDAPTGVAQITVADSGENTIIVTGGANLAMNPGVVDAQRDRLAGGPVVLTQGELPIVTIDRLARAAAEAGARFVLNEHEARAVGIGTDAAASSLDDWRGLAASAVGGIARSIVVTLGAAGAVAASADGSWSAPAEHVDAADTTGAGDGFTGTLAAFLAEGRPLGEALHIAVAAGTLAVQTRGTVDSYASREAVLRAAGLGETDADTDRSAAGDSSGATT